MALKVKYGLCRGCLRSFPRGNSGFTLVEVVLALGVFAILIVGCIGLLSLSSNSLRDVVTRDEAIHLTSALKQHLNRLSFDSAYQLVQQNKEVYVCSYRSRSEGTTTATTNADGSITKYTGTNRNAGEAYVVVPTVREAQDLLLQSNDIPSLEGRIFRVRLKVSNTNPITTLPASSSAYTEGVLTVQAQFFPLNGINPGAAPTSAGTAPSQTCTFAVLR